MKAFIKCCLGIVLTLVLGCMVTPISSAQAPERPSQSTVLDQTGRLAPTTIAQIDAENQAWSQTDQQLQVGVLLLDSLGGQDLEGLANETFRKWQIGFAGTDNGVLLLIALEDRAFRLETSDRAATVLTDTQAKRILDNSREFFRSEDYDGGILYIVDALGDQFYGTNRAQARLEEQEETEGDGNIFIIVVLVTLLLMAVGGRGGRGGRGGGDFLWLLLGMNASSSSRSRSSSSSFGGGSSGGWSGGGGGGGGASSGW